MTSFEFATAARLIFGPGTLAQAGAVAKKIGGRPLLVTGANSARAEPLRRILEPAGTQPALFSVRGEPRIQTVREGVACARENRCTWVIALGGGSALDAGKAIAAMLTNPGDPLDYLEIIGRGRLLSEPPAPLLAIPTTAGTGSEATRNAVLASPEHRLKVSLRSPMMLPSVALVDPELTRDLPPAITASTGLDALTQLIEPYVCLRANPVTDLLCREGMARVSRSFRRAFEDGRDAAAREDMALASLFGGMALANAGLGAVHGFAGPIGGMFSAPHGAICAALLPHVMQANLHALRRRLPDTQYLARYEEVARWLTGDPRAEADAGVEWVRELVAEFKIPRLGAHGIKAEHVEPLVKNALNASSMKANPVALTPEEMAGILESAL